MGRYPGSPRTQRGAVVAVDPVSPLRRTVLFQYNPDTVTRTLRPRPSGAPSAGADSGRTWGAPLERITLTLELDATDGLAAGDPVVTVAGVQPQLAALEMLLHQSTAQVLANTALLQAGSLEVLAPERPLTVLVWGPHRAVPVVVEHLTVTEQAFGVSLQPVRASVELAVQVLTASDLPPTSAGAALSLVHRVLAETSATLAGASGVGSAVAELGA